MASESKNNETTKSLLLGPEKVIKKGGKTMADKSKKEPKSTTSQGKCGCGCSGIPAKK